MKNTSELEEFLKVVPHMEFISHKLRRRLAKRLEVDSEIFETLVTRNSDRTLRNIAW